MSLKKLASSLQVEDDSFQNEFDVSYFSKKAADLYLRDKVPLNQSIKKFAQTNGFNDEQVRRICEASNHDVNQRLFDSQDDKNIQFDVADSSRILGAPEPEKLASLSFYDFSPSDLRDFSGGQDKVASIPWQAAREMKNNPEMYKQASENMDWEISELDPRSTLFNLREKFASVSEYLEDKLYMTDFRIKEAHYKLLKLAKAELQEEPYYKVAQAIALSTNRHEILEDITEELIDGNLVTEDDIYTIVKSAEELDLEHPVVVTTKKYASLLNEKELFSAAKEDIDERLKNLDYQLKD